MAHQITLIPGDGIGPEVSQATQRVLQAAGVAAAQAVVFEDATAGVQAGKDGDFGYVVGVNRQDEQHGADLERHGASIVVTKLTELL